METLFAEGGRVDKGQAQAETQTAELFESIGRLKMELEWLKQKLGVSAADKRGLIDVDHGELSVRRQCELLGLARASLYYQAAAETATNLRLMYLLDEEYTRQPCYGSRRLTAWLHGQGEEVNRKRV